MMPLWPMALLLLVLGVAAVGEVILIIYAIRKDKVPQVPLPTSSQAQARGRHVAVQQVP